jgi:DNA-binding NarL/FixJ family response regulator
MSIRIVIADDHQLLRAGIASLLRDIADVEVIGEAADGAQALRLAEELKPDILFLDLVMPRMSGLEALVTLNERMPEVRVIVLSMHASEEHVLRALRLGAAGYMLKDVAPEELGLAIRAVMAGENWLSAAVSKKVIAGYVARTNGEEALDLLTARQHQVLKLLAQGVSTKDIGTQLSLSIKTIETYRAQIMERLDIHDIPGLVRYAVRQGIVPL